MEKELYDRDILISMLVFSHLDTHLALRWTKTPSTVAGVVVIFLDLHGKALQVR